MASFEQAFRDLDSATDATFRAAGELTNTVKQMRKAAQEGNVGAIKRSAEKLKQALNILGQEVTNTAGKWPFDTESEEQYWKNEFADELRRVAGERGLTIYESDGRLIAHPSIIRVLPNERVIEIDRKKVSNIRPSRVAAALEQNQHKQPRFRPEAFLESLYSAYQMIRGGVDQGSKSKGLPANSNVEQVIPLAKVYEAFTLQPGSNREYGPSDFARSIYFLDIGDTKKTKDGSRVDFPVSTSARSGKGTFRFVGSDGNIVTYWGIKFSN